MFNFKNIFNSISSNNLKFIPMAKQNSNVEALPDYTKSKTKKELAANFDDVQNQMKQFDKDPTYKVNVDTVKQARELFDETDDKDVNKARFYTGVAVSQLNYCLTKSK